METGSDGLLRLEIDAATMFALSSSGRILRENDPDKSAGPRLFIAGCPAGNIVRVRHDVPDQTAVRILEVLAGDPPWFDPESLSGFGTP